jgi:hypothetical protein
LAKKEKRKAVFLKLSPHDASFPVRVWIPHGYTDVGGLGRHLKEKHRHKRKRYIMLALHKLQGHRQARAAGERHAAAPVRAVRLALSEPELSRLSHQGEALLKADE